MTAVNSREVTNFWKYSNKAIAKIIIHRYLCSNKT